MPTIEYPDSPDKLERRRQMEARQAKEKEQRRERSLEQGRIAWDTWEKTGSQPLEIKDRQAIAEHIGKLLEVYRVENKRGALTKLLQNQNVMFLSHPMELKDLERLRTRPGKPPNKELDARPAPYQALIRGFAKHTNIDLHILADQVLLNTSFHPVSKEDLEEAKLILEALEVAINRIDKEFKLWDQCKAIETIREPGERRFVDAIKSGGNEVALSELEQHDELSTARLAGQDAPIVKTWWPLDIVQLLNYMYVGAPVAPVNAFWINSNPQDNKYAAGVVADETILFFPHVFLGHAIEWVGGKADNFEENYFWREMNKEPESTFRFESGEYRGYRIDSKTGQDIPSEYPLVLFEMMETARWLMIYPDPEANQLIPVIFSRGDLFFNEFVPLTARLIAEFGDSSRWQSPDGAPSLLQRLRDLTGYGSRDFKIMNAWRETADRFPLNPIFRSHPGEAERVLYRRRLEAWIKEGRASLKESADL